MITLGSAQIGIDRLTKTWQLRRRLDEDIDFNKLVSSAQVLTPSHRDQVAA